MFESEEAINEYVKGPTYNRNNGAPGICFGLSIDYKPNFEYKIRLMFDDREETKVAGVPS